MDRDLSPDARHNVVSDLARFYVESEEIGSGTPVSDADLREEIASLYALSDADLISCWEGSVGEWVMSRGDLPRDPDEEMSEAWLESQFDALCAGESVEWGYISWFEIPSEADLDAPDA